MVPSQQEFCSITYDEDLILSQQIDAMPGELASALQTTTQELVQRHKLNGKEEAFICMLWKVLFNIFVSNDKLIKQKTAMDR